MRTKSQQSLAPARPAMKLAWREVLFSVAEARRALPYVARVVNDAAQAFRHAQGCRDILADSTKTEERAMLHQRRDESLKQLNNAIDECNAVGVHLVNIPNGVVRFAAQIKGRPVSLIWRMHEPIDHIWLDLVERDSQR